MKKQMFRFFLILFGSVNIMLAGCKKDGANVENDQWNTNSPAKSAVAAQQTFEELNSLTDAAFNASNLKSGVLGDCPTVTLNISELPYILTLDWGSGCTGSDGVTRSGKITISLTGKMGVPGSVATFSFLDFYSDGNKLTGTHTITYTGVDTETNWPRFDVHTEAVITFPDNKFITYNSDNIRLFAAGSDTPLNWNDDVWHIMGTASGTTRNGVSWTAETTSSLVKKVACRWFDSGTIVVTPQTGLPATIDFGDGTCDNKATLTIGDQIINVEM